VGDVLLLSTVLDRELNEEKSYDSSVPRIRCPLCGWSPRRDDRWFCTCRHEWNTFDTGASAHRACISGLKLSASHATDGHRISIGMHSEKTAVCRGLPSRESAKQCYNLAGSRFTATTGREVR